MSNMELKETYDYDANELEKVIFNQEGCDCCNGDEALVWKDNEDCAFVDSRGEIMVVVKGNTMRFNVRRCPNCGRVFQEN